jgi:hypothetical protein
MSDIGLIICLSVLTIAMFVIGYICGRVEERNKNPLEYKPSVIEQFLTIKEEESNDTKRI